MLPLQFSRGKIGDLIRAILWYTTHRDNRFSGAIFELGKGVLEIRKQDDRIRQRDCTYQSYSISERGRFDIVSKYPYELNQQ